MLCDWRPLILSPASEDAAECFGGDVEQFLRVFYELLDAFAFLEAAGAAR